jgi:hypothetical protein
MLTGPDYSQWDREPDRGLFYGCSTDEVFVVLHRLHGLDAVDRLLQEVWKVCTRESLREAAGKLDRVGLKPLAQLVRKYARKAKPAPPRWRLSPRHQAEQRSSIFSTDDGKPPR